MANISNLVLQIATNTASLDKGLKDAKSNIDSFAKSAGNVLKTIGVGLSLGVAISEFQQAIHAIEELSKEADKLGITSQAFQKLSFFASQSDTSIGSLESAMGRLSKKLGEISLSGGDGVKVLQALGLSIDSLLKQSPDQQFLSVATALSKVADHSQKAYLGSQLFGRGFKEILPLLKEDINGLSQEFDHLNIILSDSQVNAVKHLSETEHALGSLWTSFKQQTSANIAPAFDVFLTGLKNIVSETDLVKRSSLSLAEVVVNSATIMASAYNEVSKAIKNVSTTSVGGGLGAFAGSVVSGIKDDFNSLIGNDNPFRATAGQRRDNFLETTLNKTGSITPNFNSNLEKAVVQLQKIKTSLSVLDDGNQKAAAGLKDFTNATLDASERLKKFQKTPLENSLQKSGIELNDQEKDFISRLKGFSKPETGRTDDQLQADILGKLGSINTLSSSSAALEIFKAIGERNNSLKPKEGGAFGVISDANGKQAQIGTPPKQIVDVNATVKVEVNENLFTVIDQKIDQKMSTAARGASQ